MQPGLDPEGLRTRISPTIFSKPRSFSVSEFELCNRPLEQYLFFHIVTSMPQNEVPDEDGEGSGDQ